jgi:hypothetical protein
VKNGSVSDNRKKVKAKKSFKQKAKERKSFTPNKSSVNP